MKRLITLSLVLAFFTSQVFAQVATFDWAKIFASGSITGGSGETDNVNCVDAQGNIYVAGTFLANNPYIGDTDSLTLTEPGFYGFYVAKFNTAGTLLWKKTGAISYPQSFRLVGIAVDSQNKLYVGLNFDDTLYYAGSQFIDNGVAANNEYAAFCIDKSNGSFISRTTFSTTGSNYHAKLDVNASDELTTVFLKTDSIIIEKINNTGAIILRKSWIVSGSVSGLEFNAFDATQGNIFLSGFFNNNFGISTASFANTLGNSWAIRFDNLGNVTWSLQCKATGAGSQETLITSISEESNGNFYVLGHFTGTATFTGTLQTVSGGEQLYYAKYNSAGNLVWLKQSTGLGTTAGRRIRVGADNKLYLMGNLDAKPIFLGGDSTLQTLVISSTDRCFLAQMDTSGNTLWLKRVNNTGGIQDVGDRRINVDMYLDSTSNIYFTGSYDANTSLNIGLFSLPNIPNQANKFFFAKTSANPIPVGMFDHFEQNTAGVVIYPNPSSGIFQISPNGLQLSKLEIYNLLGEKVYASPIKAENNLRIDLSNQSPGIYFVRIYEGEKISTAKIIVQ